MSLLVLVRLILLADHPVLLLLALRPLIHHHQVLHHLVLPHPVLIVVVGVNHLALVEVGVVDEDVRGLLLER